MPPSLLRSHRCSCFQTPYNIPDLVGGLGAAFQYLPMTAVAHGNIIYVCWGSMRQQLIGANLSCQEQLQGPSYIYIYIMCKASTSVRLNAGGASGLEVSNEINEVPIEGRR